MKRTDAIEDLAAYWQAEAERHIRAAEYATRQFKRCQEELGRIALDNVIQLPPRLTLIQGGLHD